jgi:hypothetical protein
MWASLGCLIALHHTQQDLQPVILRLAHSPGDDGGRTVFLAQLAMVAAIGFLLVQIEYPTSISIPPYEAQSADERPDFSQDALSSACHRCDSNVGADSRPPVNLNLILPYRRTIRSLEKADTTCLQWGRLQS